MIIACAMERFATFLWWLRTCACGRATRYGSAQHRYEATSSRTAETTSNPTAIGIGNANLTQVTERLCGRRLDRAGNKESTPSYMTNDRRR